ncbi:MAG TPA: cytochrome c [Xanthomonadales bacterium]
MRRLTIILGGLALAVVLLFLVTRPVGLPAGMLPAHTVDIANGEILFHASGCASCHASVDADTEPAILGGGLALDTPFGTFLVPNISPHPDHGIGRWSTLDFVNAMHLGVSPGGRHYYPAFPYPSYTRMRLEDLMDLKSYLDTLPQAQNPNQEHDLTFPWNVRAGIGLWKLLNLDPAAVVSVPPDNKDLVRGRYLVEGPGHCGECHTPRNWSGGLDNSRWLSGAPNPEGEGKVPNITPDENGLAEWSQRDIEYYLSSGLTPDFDTVGGSMVEVQANMARLSAEDRAAIAAYLKAVPPLH